MKANLTKPILWACLALASTLGAIANPLNRADVPAEPVWVFHLDCDMLRPTALGQFLLSEMEKPEAQAKLSVFESLFSFDPRKQLHGLTLYSTTKGSEDGVLLLYADFDPERLITVARSAKEYQSKKHHDHVIHSWVDDKRHGKAPAGRRTYAAIHGKRVVFGQRWSRVSEALDVLDRTAASLASSSAFSQLGLAGTANFIEASARKLEVGDQDPSAQIFKLSKMVRLQAGESQGQLTATLNLETNDEETARLVANIAQGLVSLAKLQKAQSARFVDALTLKQEGAAVIGTLSLPAKDAVALLKEDAARKEKEKATKAAKATKAEDEQ